MQKFIVFFILLMCFKTKAQNPITAVKNPVVGDSYSYREADTTGVVNGPSGVNQFWNYSGVVISPTAAVYAFTYVPVSSVPNASLYPTANMAEDDGTGIYDVVDINSTGGFILGHAQATPSSCIVYGDPWQGFSVPFGYGNSATDTFSYTTSSGAIANGSSTTTADGTGTVSLPGSMVYANILRVRTDFIIIYSGTSTGTFISTVYGYNSPVNKFALLSIQDYTFYTGSTPLIEKIIKTNADIILGVGSPEKANSFIAFPNPASGTNLFIRSLRENGREIALYNSTGELVKRVSLREQDHMPVKSIDVSELPKGIYYLKINCKNADKPWKIIIE